MVCLPQSCCVGKATGPKLQCVRHPFQLFSSGVFFCCSYLCEKPPCPVSVLQNVDLQGYLYWWQTIFVLVEFVTMPL